jgi:cytoskeletal protein CcmA (bactofilin family)
MWSKESPRDTRVNPVSTPEYASPRTEQRPVAEASSSELRSANIGRSVTVKGEVTGSEDLTVDGRVEGKIDLPEHTLTIGPNATIHADIKAKVVTIFGTVKGSVVARDKAELRRGATLEGDLASTSVSIQEGSQFTGKVDMTRRGRPQAEAKPAQAQAETKPDKAAAPLATAVA